MDIISITPKLPVRDAGAALAYYAAALGAEVTQRYEHAGAVVFAELRRGALAVQVKDGDAVDPAPEPGRRSGVLLDVGTPDPNGLAEAFLAGGGEVVFPMADQPYGVRQGRIRDPFGHEWIIGSPNTMTPAQVQAALEDT
ncbi:MAG: VOC family protein [Tetrasphaera sp.]|nr:VOC family protein [Tetrasphaera sp.]